jgi:hypothetical protein
MISSGERINKLKEIIKPDNYTYTTDPRLMRRTQFLREELIIRH